MQQINIIQSINHLLQVLIVDCIDLFDIVVELLEASTLGIWD